MPLLASGAVGERSLSREAAAQACRGGVASANAGMSNDSGGENPPHRKPEGSAARALRGGVGGPKPRARAVGDGQQVNIPVPLDLSEGVTQKDSSASVLDIGGAKQLGDEAHWQIRALT